VRLPFRHLTILGAKDFHLRTSFIDTSTNQIETRIATLPYKKDETRSFHAHRGCGFD
jgi:hypothetical protein